TDGVARLLGRRETALLWITGLRLPRIARLWIALGLPRVTLRHSGGRLRVARLAAIAWIGGLAWIRVVRWCGHGSPPRVSRSSVRAGAANSWNLADGRATRRLQDHPVCSAARTGSAS